MPVVIRRTEPADMPSYRDALDEVARERATIAWFEAPPLERLRAFVEGGLAAGNPHFVAVENGSVVGWCDVTRKDRHVNTHVGVLGMGIRKAWRGQGVGRALITATIEAASAAGMSRIELHVHDDNATAIALYTRAGFEREGVQRKAALIDGRFIDVLMMARLS